MLLDIRNDHCRPGSFKKPPALDEKLAKGSQTHWLDRSRSFLVTETGKPHQYLPSWTCENAGDRERQPAARWIDPA